MDIGIISSNLVETCHHSSQLRRTLHTRTALQASLPEKENLKKERHEETHSLKGWLS
jgi:hypothetical protein